MASAGRILIMPKGNWKEETEYEMLDLVYHGGTSWLAKKDVAAEIEPTSDNEDYWMKVFDAGEFTESVIEAKVKEYMENNTTA